jgi:hypothetical protein
VRPLLQGIGAGVGLAAALALALTAWARCADLGPVVRALPVVFDAGRRDR